MSNLAQICPVKREDDTMGNGEVQVHGILMEGIRRLSTVTVL
jgi:hypothetical protein